MVAQHIANGMYGAILVEPEEGLPKVDREFYVVQGEIYTEEDHDAQGELTESIGKLLDEDAEFYVFNGAFKALTGDRTGQYSIRINLQWRICFRWTDDGPDAVEIVDYH
jgi:nitrite reductase (NO-forming)